MVSEKRKFTEAELDALVDQMSLAQADAAVEAIEALASRKREGKLYQYEPQDHQVAVHADKHKIVDVRGGNRCIGGEQLIYDPVANTHKRVDQIDSDFHVWAWDGKSKVIALAHRPFQKAKDDLYQLTFDDGTEIVVSPHHLLWGPKGWLECSLYAEQREVFAPHPATNWDIYPQVHLGDVEHLRYTTQGFQSDYRSHRNSCGEQLHSDLTCAQEIQPSQDDVQEHMLASALCPCDAPLDAPVGGLEYTRACQNVCPPASLGALPPHGGLSAGNESQNACKPWKQAWDLLQATCRWLHGLVNPLQPIAASGPQANRSPLDFSLIPDQSHPLSVSIPLLTSNRRVVQINYLRNDFVWDFSMDDYNNYFIGDILNHNSGKSESCAFSVACHVLGIYPDWWTGLRFTEHIFIGVISISTEQLRKSAQVKLMGEPHELGTGYIPRDKIVDYAWRAGTNGCLDWVLVRNADGGLSRIQFMVSEQGMAKFMGYTWSLAWFDEIPEQDIFVEVQMRLVDKQGYIILSYYPKDGETELTQKLDKMPDEYCSHYELHMQDNATIDPDEMMIMPKTTEVV